MIAELTMPRTYSLAYMTSHRCTPVQSVSIAAQLGYAYVGLRPWPNVPAGPHQPLIGQPEALRETLAAMRDTGVKVFDLEIIRLQPEFDVQAWAALYELGAALQARNILVVSDDRDEARVSTHFGQLCEALAPYGLKAELEFMAWTGVRDARAAMRVLHAAGSPSNAGILVDALHVGRSTTTLEDLRAIPREWLHYVQLCDGAAGTHFTDEELIHTARCERLFPGEGTIDLAGILQSLPEDLPISVEIIHLAREATSDPLDWAGRCLDATRRMVDGAVLSQP
jgi:sugar phosphate isomerase/epimerase